MNTEVNQEPGKEEAPAGSSSSAPHESNQSTESSVPGAERPHQAGLSPRIQGLHTEHLQVRRLFAGTGKKDSKLLSGPGEYDRAYVAKLTNYGVSDASELAAAVLSRPDGYAVRQGEPYVSKLVADAIEAAAARNAEVVVNDDAELERARSLADFAVDRARVLAADRSRYELEIGGDVLVLTVDQLANPKDFKKAFFNKFHRFPKTPPATGKRGDLWQVLVNGWMRQAQQQRLVGNSSADAVLARHVEKAVSGLGAGDSKEALHDDMAWVENGRRYFTADPIFQRVRHLDAKLRHEDVARVLSTVLGCEFHPGFPAGTTAIDVWSTVAKEHP